MRNTDIHTELVHKDYHTFIHCSSVTTQMSLSGETDAHSGTTVLWQNIQKQTEQLLIHAATPTSYLRIKLHEKDHVQILLIY